MLEAWWGILGWQPGNLVIQLRIPEHEKLVGFWKQACDLGVTPRVDDVFACGWRQQKT